MLPDNHEIAIFVTTAAGLGHKLFSLLVQILFVCIYPGKDDALTHNVYRLMNVYSAIILENEKTYTLDFEKAYQDINEGCRGLLDYLKKWKA